MKHEKRVCFMHWVANCPRVVVVVVVNNSNLELLWTLDSASHGLLEVKLVKQLIESIGKFEVGWFGSLWQHENGFHRRGCSWANVIWIFAGWLIFYFLFFKINLFNMFTLSLYSPLYAGNIYSLLFFVDKNEI